jgi:site-specific DNA-methyltransferase (adenine-specific)
MGSGSTGVAAQNTGRDFIGMELDEGYFEVAARRLQANIKVSEEKSKVLVS